MLVLLVVVRPILLMLHVLMRWCVLLHLRKGVLLHKM